MKKTGYSVATARRRLEGVAAELLLMVGDERLSEYQAHTARGHVLAAIEALKGCP